MRTSSRQIAFGGMFAALAMVIMNLGGMIPVATFVCPVLCMLILCFVIKMCGKRIGWAWYGAVAILSLLMAPDKEAAAVFAFLGYYPVVKPRLDRMRFSMLWKFLLFNGSVFLVYGLLLSLLGLSRIVAEYRGMGIAMTVVMLMLGNVTFYLLDKALTKFANRK